MYFEVIELYQEDCPNITLTEKVKGLNIFIVDVLPSYERETLKAYIVGENSKSAIEKLTSSDRVLSLEIYSKSKDVIETRYDIAMTRAWKIVHSFGGRVVSPIIVHEDSERWLVVWDDVKKRKSAIEELRKTDLARVRRSYEIEPCVFSKIFLNIENLAYMIKELSNLTTVQLNSLKEAYQNGLYDVPRRTTLETLSAKSGISKTAYLKRLKSAEKRIVFGVLKFFNSLY
jgi:hypothetical protein